ncbi:hypothetical protein AUR64_18995 [Haloprofundus marisrubri]|uniref:DUF4013 domain-containing protein n=1 Tax=Haloprofundus marisrubri TaxID=1514971 RepID=A0A0W1R5R6_9EURY|nr:DUF4013 domain-containing protein [Haloprofundus marisrubri]KTG08431.1 hypothetical protein AUR64_18995 [Haloprofundus marisrubri]
MLTESLSYVRNSDDWLKNVLIGGVLSLLGFLIIPTFLVLGYLLRVVRSSMRGEERPPAFDEWGEMLVDGLKGFAIALAYSLVPLLLAIVFAVLTGVTANGGDIGVVSGLFGLVGALLVFVTSLAVAYALPAGLASYAETDRMGSAFDTGMLRSTLTSGTYATAWVTAFVVFLGAGIVAGALNVVPLLGTVVGVFVSFYAAVAGYHIIGRAWGEMHPVEMRDGEMPDERAAI